jgi:hypothetical protein
MDNPRRVRIYQRQLEIPPTCVTINGFWRITSAQRRRVNKKFFRGGGPEANQLSIENMKAARLDSSVVSKPSGLDKIMSHL